MGIWMRVHQTPADEPVHLPNSGACVKMWLASHDQAESGLYHQANRGSSIPGLKTGPRGTRPLHRSSVTPRGWQRAHLARRRGQRQRTGTRGPFWLPSSHLEASILHTRRCVHKHSSRKANQGQLVNKLALSTCPSHCAMGSSLMVGRIFSFGVLYDIRCFPDHIKNEMKADTVCFPQPFLKYHLLISPNAKLGSPSMLRPQSRTVLVSLASKNSLLWWFA